MTHGKRISSHYHDQEPDRQKVITIIILFFLGSGFLVTQGISILYITLLAVPFFVLNPILAPAAYRLWLRPAVRLYEEGVHYSDRRRSHFWAWDTIQDIRVLPSRFERKPRYELRVNDQRVLLIDSRFLKRDTLTYNIGNALVKAGNYEQLLEKGETLREGKLSISYQGLEWETTFIPWAKIREAYFSMETFRMLIEHTDDTISQIQVNNLLTALLLLHLVGKSRKKTALPRVGEVSESRLFKLGSVLQVAIAVIGIGVGLFVIFPRIITAFQFNLINLGGFLSMLFALIIPVISLIVLWRESKLLLENPRMVVSGDGLRRITRSGEMHWNWADFSDVKITWNTAWFISERIEVVFYQGEKKAVTLDSRYVPFEYQGDTSIDHYLAAHFSRFKQAFERSETLAFGKVRVDQRGVQFKHKRYAWNDTDFDILNIEGQIYLILFSSDNRRLGKLPILGLSNAPVLVELLQEQITGQVSAYTPLEEQSIT